MAGQRDVLVLVGVPVDVPELDENGGGRSWARTHVCVIEIPYSRILKNVPKIMGPWLAIGVSVPVLQRDRRLIRTRPQLDSASTY